MYSISKEKNYMTIKLKQCSQCTSSFTYANNGFLIVDWKREHSATVRLKEIAWSTKE